MTDGNTPEHQQLPILVLHSANVCKCHWTDIL